MYYINVAQAGISSGLTRPMFSYVLGFLLCLGTRKVEENGVGSFVVV